MWWCSSCCEGGRAGNRGVATSGGQAPPAGSCPRPAPGQGRAALPGLTGCRLGSFPVGFYCSAVWDALRSSDPVPVTHSLNAAAIREKKVLNRTLPKIFPNNLFSQFFLLLWHFPNFLLSALSWFNPSRQLSPTQPLAHFPQWDRGENQRGKSKKTRGLR